MAYGREARSGACAAMLAKVGQRLRVPALLGEPYPMPPPLLLQPVPLAPLLRHPSLLRHLGCESNTHPSFRQPWHVCGRADRLLRLLLRRLVGAVELRIYLRRLLLRELLHSPLLLLRPLLLPLHLHLRSLRPRQIIQLRLRRLRLLLLIRDQLLAAPLGGLPLCKLLLVRLLPQPQLLRLQRLRRLRRLQRLLLRRLLLLLLLLLLLPLPLLLLVLLLRLPLLLVQQRLLLLLPLLPLPLLQLGRLTVGESDSLVQLRLVDLARPGYVGLQPGHMGLQPGRTQASTL